MPKHSLYSLFTIYYIQHTYLWSGITRLVSFLWSSTSVVKRCLCLLHNCWLTKDDSTVSGRLSALLTNLKSIFIQFLLTIHYLLQTMHTNYSCTTFFYQFHNPLYTCLITLRLALVYYISENFWPPLGPNQWPL